MALLTTPLTAMLGIEHPVLLAGMAAVSNADLAAAVSNAGGMGVVGGAFMSPEALRKIVLEMKAKLDRPDLPFGIDLLLPKVGDGARATNYDYTKGQLASLIDVVVQEKASMFICAVGVPPRWVVEKLHSHDILVMNMVGSPRHVPKAIAVGVDLICAQGTEAGGHTGEVATMALIPQCVDICRGHTAPLRGGPVRVVAAGGIFDGRGLAAALALGADAVWVGTRFVAAEEAGASGRHQRLICEAGADDTVRTLIYSGRPMRIHKTQYVLGWQEAARAEERDAILKSGRRVYKTDLARHKEAGTPLSFADTYPVIFGQACGGIRRVQPAAEIVRSMVTDAADIMSVNATRFVRPPPGPAAAKL